MLAFPQRVVSHATNQPVRCLLVLPFNVVCACARVCWYGAEFRFLSNSAALFSCNQHSISDTRVCVLVFLGTAVAFSCATKPLPHRPGVALRGSCLLACSRTASRSAHTSCSSLFSKFLFYFWLVVLPACLGFASPQPCILSHASLQWGPSLLLLFALCSCFAGRALPS